MTKKKMLKVRRKRVLAGILCATLLVSEADTIGLYSYAAEMNTAADTGETEEIEKETEAGQPKAGAEAGDSLGNEETKESASDGNQDNLGGKKDKDENPDGEEAEAGQETPPDGQDRPALEESGDDLKKEPVTEDGNDGEGADWNEDGTPSVSENTESAEEEDGVAGEDYALTTSADDIASGVVDESYGHIEWVIDKNGKLTVSGWGDYAKKMGSYRMSAPWFLDRWSIKTAEINVTGMTDASEMFEGCSYMTTVNLNNFDTKDMKNMDLMFYNCGLESIDMTDLDLSSVVNMNRMFWDCNNLKSIDLSGLNLSSVQDMSFMFESCSDLSNINLSGLKIDSVVNMRGMFEHCISLTSIDLCNLNTGNVTDMRDMFWGCSSLSSIDLDGLDTSNVMNMSGMFHGCNSLNSIDLDGLDTSNVENMGGMFRDCSSIERIDLRGLDTSSVTNMSDMFNGCDSLSSIEMSGLDVSSVTDMGSMFWWCSSLRSIDLGGLNASNVVDMSYMFIECSSLQSIELNGLDTRSVMFMSHMFDGCSNLGSIDMSGLDIGKATDMSYMFFHCSNLSSVEIDNVDTGNVTDMNRMFCGCSSLRSIDLSGMNAGSVIDMHYMLDICDKLTTIYSPCNVVATCTLPTNVGDIWYRSDGTAVTEIPQNLDYSIALGRNYIPEELPYEPDEPPTDITENGITINGKGYAYANFILRNNNGKVQRNAKITYSIDGNSYEAVSDRNGLIAIKSPLLENKTGKNEQKSIKVNDMILHYASKQTELLNYSVTMDVTVSPLSFTQKWELGAEGSITGGVSGGAGVTVGVAQVEASLAKAEISGTAGGTLSVEHSFEDGARSLTLLQNYESKVAAKAKMGPAAKAGVLGQDLDIDIVTAGAGVASGQSVGIGLKLDHYDPNDMGQVADIGKFMLGSQAQAGGNMMMLQLAERAGFDFWNLERYGAKTSLEDGADVGCIKFGDAAEGTLASLSAEQTISYDMQRDKTNESRELSFGYELGTAVNVGEISIAHVKDSIFSKSDGNKLEISAGIEGDNRVENFTVKKEEKSADGFLHEKGTVETVAVIYDREDVEQLKKNIGVIGEFLSGSTKYIFGDAQQELFKQLDNTPVRGSYSTTVANQEKQDVKLAFGFEMGFKLEAGIGFEGVSSCEYETAGGIYEKGKRYITNTNEIEAEVKENAYSIERIVGEPLKAIGERLKNYLQDNYDKLKNGVQNGGAAIEQGVLGPINQWVVHIVSLKEEKTRASAFQSYEIMAYDVEEMFGQEINGSTDAAVDEYKAYTIGNPYYVYVTDESENEIMDYTENPLILTLSYTDEMLAGADLAEKEAHNLAVYMYSQEFCGYVCVGGIVDTEAKAVSVQITKPGQYILATDSVSPTVKSITVSRDTNKPVITVEFNETSGFQMFSMKLDGEEVIGAADWSKYYNKIYNSFSYQVEKELTDGKHICTVYAVDTVGNAMTVPYETEFYIGKAPSGDVLEEDIPSDGVIPDGIWAAGIGNCTYTGKNLIQSFRLYDGKKRLQEKTDYTVSYKNNKFAYTYSEEDYKAFEDNLQKTEQRVKTGTFDPKKAPQIVIRMKGNYAGNKIVYFRIEPEELSGDAFEADNLAVTYTGKKQTPTPKLTWNGKALKYGTDFYVPQYDKAKNDKEAFKKPQTYTLTLTGKQNFAGELPITLTISQNEKQIAMDKVTVKGIRNVTWTGNQIMQTGFTVKYKNKVLSVGNGDYTIQWGTNTDVGTGTLLSTGTGEDRDGDGYSFIGTKKVSFQITGNAMNRVSVSGVERKYAYTGSAIKPAAKVTYQVNKNANSVTLTEGIHYTVTYQKNVDKGTATILFTGLASGGYTGTKKLSFGIVSSEIGNTTGGTEIRIDFVDSENVKNGIYNALYMKGGAKPEVKVASGEKTLTEGKDYRIKYTNNRKVALSTDTKAPTVIVTGKGNYKGTKSVKFSILAKALSNENGITVVAKDKIASTKANGFRQTFKVYDADGKTLGNRDYDSKSITYTLVRTTKNDGIVSEENRILDKNSVVPADSVVQITVRGKGIYAGGEATGIYRILKKDHDIGKATIQIKNQAYTGNPITIAEQGQFVTGKVFIKIGGEKRELLLGEDMEVVPGSYIKNVNRGTAKVTFRGIHDYGGTKTVSFKIGTRSIGDFWKGIFGGISALMS